MSSGFSFGFEDEADDLYVAPDASAVASASQEANTEHPSPLVDAKAHSLESLVSGLPSSLQYNSKISAPPDGHSVLIPQRDFHDIKAQLMAEDDGLNPIHGISSQDLEPRKYEGGFKTWECAEDLSNYLIHDYPDLHGEERKTIVLELGAGTAMPSCTLLQSHLRRTRAEPGRTATKFIVADYNQSVLEVATIPNILLTWATSSGMLNTKDTLEVTTEVKRSFLESMTANRVSVDAISGAWSSAFVDIFLSLSQLTGQEHVLILASETIYSPASLQSFTSTLVQILRAIKQKGSRPIALIASKKFYFGVGGGIDDFVAQLKQSGGNSQIVWQTKGEGIGRAIVAASIPPDA